MLPKGDYGKKVLDFLRDIGFILKRAFCLWSLITDVSLNIQWKRNYVGLRKIRRNERIHVIGRCLRLDEKMASSDIDVMIKFLRNIFKHLRSIEIFDNAKSDCPAVFVYQRENVARNLHKPHTIRDLVSFPTVWNYHRITTKKKKEELKVQRGFDKKKRTHRCFKRRSFSRFTGKHTRIGVYYRLKLSGYLLIPDNMCFSYKITNKSSRNDFILFN